MGCWSKEIKAAYFPGNEISFFSGGTARNTGDLIKKKRTERSLHAIIEEKIRREFMENIVFIIVMEGCAVLFLYLGFLLWKKQQIQQGYLLKQG